jgi:hypothetical protein
VVGSPASPSSDRPFVDGANDLLQDARTGRNIYVVHSDGGSGDVHIQLPQGGGRVIELPPNYRDEPRSSPAAAVMPTSPVPAGASSDGAAHAASNEGGLRRAHTFGNTRQGHASPTADPPIPLSPMPAEVVRSLSRQSAHSGQAEAQMGMSPDEIRARAEAAMAEKGRLPN